jgi:hypothetical protein
MSELPTILLTTVRVVPKLTSILTVIVDPKQHLPVTDPEDVAINGPPVEIDLPQLALSTTDTALEHVIVSETDNELFNQQRPVTVTLPRNSASDSTPTDPVTERPPLIPQSLPKFESPLIDTPIATVAERATEALLPMRAWSLLDNRPPMHPFRTIVRSLPSIQLAKIEVLAPTICEPDVVIDPQQFTEPSSKRSDPEYMLPSAESMQPILELPSTDIDDPHSQRFNTLTDSPNVAESPVLREPTTDKLPPNKPLFLTKHKSAILSDDPPWIQSSTVRDAPA